MKMEKNALDSDHRNRTDLQALRSGNIPLAQEQKEVLENFQRGDRKLRENWEKANKKKR